MPTPMARTQKQTLGNVDLGHVTEACDSWTTTWNPKNNITYNSLAATVLVIALERQESEP